SQMGGTFRSSLIGNAGFLKVDTAISPRHFLTARLSTSRYYGDNNVFFDPASPITNYAISENGQEDVRTESAVVSLTSGLTRRATSHLRMQFSRDLQSSEANSSYPLTQIYSIIQGFGRSNILPRETREHKWHIAETITVEGNRHSFKFGGDLVASYIYNFFPQQFGGDYIFDDISVDPWTFQPVRAGMQITPLRAYAHQVPRYYYQDFGSAVAHPDTTEYAAFAQDSVRLFSRFALVFGVRYDLQRFRTDGLVSNLLWPDSGRVPNDTNNISPRVGFAYSIGERRPLVIRGGYGLFYTRIPSIYTSAVETENGINNTHVFLRNTNFYDRLLFPTYPNPLVACPSHATACAAPAGVAGSLTSDVSAFAHDFQTPYVHQANLGLEREIVERLAIAVNYLYVRGEHLIRARDANLTAPVEFTYPVFDQTGQNFLGTYYTVDSFANWQMTPTLDCPFPPCVGDVVRPIPELGSINVLESAATSEYHGLTISARRRMSHGLYFRLAYTWARAMDDGQDALVAGRPATVQNSYAPNSEYGPSSTDQRQRLAVSWIAEPHPFHREHNVLKTMCNEWKLSGVATYGSGRPFDARILGDANRDGNSDNDRLPGYRRNAFTGPDYSTVDARVARQFPIGDRWKLELLAESFNLLNRDNKRVDITDDGFTNTAAQFVTINKTVANRVYPAYYQSATSFLKPNNSYAPRQVQFAVRVIY
ncbi:MAG TPA: TonB-dependent receptor, partial [Terriglobales bacterium]|nr:TonB-dependent receptor [Terriglobales bacterium]